MKHRKICQKALAVGFAAGLASSASASQLTYVPVNPAFGGSPLNGSYLLGVANAINKYEDPKASVTVDPGTKFVQQLQSQLLSSLSTQVTNIIFGENAQPSGEITFGDQTISFVRSLDSVSLTITNTSTGVVTEIDIPVLQTSSSGPGRPGGAR